MVSSFLAGEIAFMKASISPIKVRTKSATVSSELASDTTRAPAGRSDKYISEQFQTKIHFIELRVPVRFAERVVVSLVLFPLFLRAWRLPAEDSTFDFTGAKGQPSEGSCDGTVRIGL